jgi:hypothetical protein
MHKAWLAFIGCINEYASLLPKFHRNISRIIKWFLHEGGGYESSGYIVPELSVVIRLLNQHQLPLLIKIAAV